MKCCNLFRSGLIAVALFCLGVNALSLCAAEPVGATSKAVQVLVLTGSDMVMDPALSKRFEGENIHFVTRKITEPLNAEMLRAFHVVLIVDWEVGLRTEWFSPRGFMINHLTSKKNGELVNAFVQSGGGLFYTPPFGSPMSIEGEMRFFGQYGAVIEPLQIRDDKHAYSNPPAEKKGDFFEYAWTTNIGKHPATGEVKCIYYPTPQLRWDDMYSTPVITLKDPAWTPLVRGMDTSVASKCYGYTQWEASEEKSPVIAAVRQSGSGRVGVFMPNAYYTFWKPDAKPVDGWVAESHTGRIDGIFMEKGDGKTGSDGFKLLTGMLRWLSDGAREKGLGMYDAKSFAALPKPEKELPLDWIESWNPDDGNKWFKVLVGARSSYSDGEGSIADYAQEAKKSGISMLYMTETFERFDPKKWNAFLEDCAKASDATLKVIPGLDISDTCGNRYLSLTSTLFPPKQLLTADGKALAKPHYLCLCFPRGTTVIYRATGSTVPEEMVKHFHGFGLYTYRNGTLEDNSFPGYQWQVFRFSNPLPFVVHETYSPKNLQKEAETGHQMLVSADTLENLAWYMGEHGTSHFWENPLHIQISSGPKITALERGSLVPEEESVGGALSFTVTSDEPIKEVRLMENFNLYRRWTPNTKNFTANNVKLPEEHVSWSMIVATDAKGRTVISPGVVSGKQASHTWRCGDRQNWWSFPDIYTGTHVNQFDIQVPVFGTKEGQGIYPEIKPPLRGDDMAALLDFSYASPAAYIQDVFLDQRYNYAVYEDFAYDAKSANTTARSRVYEAKVRHYQFFAKTENNEKSDIYPVINEIDLSLRRPTDPTGEVFPIITRLDTHNSQVRGDMSYSYTDTATGKKVAGRLTQGYLDLPKGGVVGGFIALSDGIRVSANGEVGFAASTVVEGALPAGTRWRAKFVTVAPAEVETWLNLMGLFGKPPFEVNLTKGKLSEFAYVEQTEAEDYGVAGAISKPLPDGFVKNLSLGYVNRDKEGYGGLLTDYRLPVSVSGVNYNWPAALVRDGHWVESVDVFEGKAWARLDLKKGGDFYIGNAVKATNRNLRIGVQKWTASGIVLEVHNPTDASITATLSTASEVRDRFQFSREITVKAGRSELLKETKEK